MLCYWGSKSATRTGVTNCCQTLNSSLRSFHLASFWATQNGIVENPNLLEYYAVSTGNWSSGRRRVHLRLIYPEDKGISFLPNDGSYQMKHPRCVDKNASISKMHSNTTFNIYIAKRCFYIVCLNNYMFRLLYRPSSGCTLVYCIVGFIIRKCTTWWWLI